jgi:hypothetical protein
VSGLKLTYHLDKENQLDSIDGIVEGTGLNVDNLKTDYKQGQEMFPAEPVKPGDTWERTEEMNLGEGQVFVLKRKYEYVGTTPKSPTVKDSPLLDKITATDTSVEFAIKGPAAAALTVKSDLKVESSKHTFLFDREQGRVVNRQVDLKVAGTITIVANGMELPGMLEVSLESRREELE